MNDFNKLLRDGYRFEMGQYMGHGWKLFSKGAGSLIGFLLLSFVILIILSVLLSFIPILGLAVNFIMAILFSGMFIFCRQLTKGHQDFGDFFKGFKFSGQLILHYLVLVLMLAPIFIMMFIYVIPMDSLAEMNPMDLSSNFEFQQEVNEEMMANMSRFIWIMIPVYVLTFYVSLSYLFAVPLIVDAKLGFWQAMELSRRVVGKRFFSFLGMFILLIIMMWVALIFTCGLGMIVAGPYMLCVIFAAYDKIFTPHMDSLESQVDTFGSTSEDSNVEDVD